MIWIVSAGIDENVEERRARLQFIKEVSGDKYISWEKKHGISPRGFFEYYQCATKDGINGTFITAHNNIVAILCGQSNVTQGELVVANTCKIVAGFEQFVLQLLQRQNVSAQLYYAKQDKEVVRGTEYDTNTASYIGNFGFKTSKSERILYRNKENGLVEAIKKAFDYIINEDEINEKSI